MLHRTSVTETFTKRWTAPQPATPFPPAYRRQPLRHCSYNVLAVTSTVCATPPNPVIVTRQDRIAINAKISYSLFYSHIRRNVFLNFFPPGKIADGVTAAIQTAVPPRALDFRLVFAHFLSGARVGEITGWLGGAHPKLDSHPTSPSNLKIIVGLE